MSNEQSQPLISHKRSDQSDPSDPSDMSDLKVLNDFNDLTLLNAPSNY